MTKINDQPIALNKTQLVSVCIFMLSTLVEIYLDLWSRLGLMLPINAGQSCGFQSWTRCAAACIKCYVEFCTHTGHGLRSNKISNQIISTPTRSRTNPATVNTFWIRIVNVPPTPIYSLFCTLCLLFSLKHQKLFKFYIFNIFQLVIACTYGILKASSLEWCEQLATERRHLRCSQAPNFVFAVFLIESHSPTWSW